MSKLKKSLIFIITTVSLILLSLLIFALAVKDILPLPAIFIWCLTTPAIVTCMAYFLYYLIEWKTGRKVRMIIPLTCLAITVISGVTGVISYVNDHSFMMRGFEAELIWFLITLPALAAMTVHFILAFIQNRNELKKLKEQRQIGIC